MQNLLKEHKHIADVEYNPYINLRNSVLRGQQPDKVHLVIDLAEKVLLPSVEMQPGNLLFVTGRKFDFFGVSRSNEGTNTIFGLPEGHWPGGKTANEVVSMLHYIVMEHKSNETTAEIQRLIIHADNCA